MVLGHETFISQTWLAESYWTTRLGTPAHVDAIARSHAHKVRARAAWRSLTNHWCAHVAGWRHAIALLVPPTLGVGMSITSDGWQSRLVNNYVSVYLLYMPPFLMHSCVPFSRFRVLVLRASAAAPRSACTWPLYWCFRAAALRSCTWPGSSCLAS